MNFDNFETEDISSLSLTNYNNDDIIITQRELMIGAGLFSSLFSIGKKLISPIARTLLGDIGKPIAKHAKAVIKDVVEQKKQQFQDFGQNLRGQTQGYAQQLQRGISDIGQRISQYDPNQYIPQYQQFQQPQQYQQPYQPQPQYQQQQPQYQQQRYPSRLNFI